MIYLIGNFILAFALLQLIAALSNFLFKERLPSVDASEVLHSLSVLIPARDEEKNIGQLLSDLVKIPDHISEIIVYDDQSADNTASVVKEFAARDGRIKLISGKELPDDWYGKNHACYQLSQETESDYILFLDADVRISGEVVGHAVKYMEKRRCSMMSIFPTQEMKSFGEKITVPNMQIILVTLLSLPLVRLSGFPSLAAANGQFMMFRHDTYKELDPHSKFRKSRAEDIEISRYMKRQRKKVSCLTGIKGVRCRMYHSAKDAVDGFSRNVTFFFGNSMIAAILYWLVTTLGFIVFLADGRTEALWIWLSTTILTRIFASVTAAMKVSDNLLLWVPQQVMLGKFIVHSFLNSIKKSFSWKGRSI
ncbi:MAG TPA: glycosyl transferase [Porphyromonadaceae bacterium]|jgi:glycosyltransferase involved in cell wall biosynthesis|nr:glycosyl transferase [Porphyromonadaceae bacterium]